MKIMFVLKLFDRLGNELSEGDIVKISDGERFSFYSEIKYLESENVIAPFHTFSFHSMEKVDRVPEIATKSTEERYGIWYVCIDDSESDNKSLEDFQNYLMSWRECEYAINDRCWRIDKINSKQQNL
jgi:hypothetical protein